MLESNPLELPFSKKGLGTPCWVPESFHERVLILVKSLKWPARGFGLRPKKCNRPVADPETSPHSIDAREKKTVVPWVEISPSNGFFKTIGFYCKDMWLNIIQVQTTSNALYSCFKKNRRKKMCTRQSRKVIWNIINTLSFDTVAVEPTFVAFL